MKKFFVRRFLLCSTIMMSFSVDALSSEKNIDQEINSSSNIENKDEAIIDPSKKLKINSVSSITLTPAPVIIIDQQSFKLSGYMDLDSAYYSNNKDGTTGEMGIRYARIDLTGKINDAWGYRFQPDFAGGTVDIKKAYLENTSFASWRIRVGQMSTTYGLDTEGTFLESPITGSIVPPTTLGIELQTHNKIKDTDNYVFSVALTTDDKIKNNSSQSRRRSAYSRLGYAPFVSDKMTAQFAVSVGKSRAKNDLTTYSFSGYPGSNLASKAVDTGNLDHIKYVNYHIGEFFTICGPFSFEVEYSGGQIKRSSAYTSPKIKAWYTQIAYSLTGENRVYDAANGMISSLIPAKPFQYGTDDIGAWEMAFRYEDLNLNDSGASFNYGRMRNYTVGLNWYVNNNVKFMADYLISNTDQYAVKPNNKPRAVMLRTHIAF